MNGLNLRRKILIWTLPVIIVCLCGFLSTANAKLNAEQAKELGEIKRAIKAKGAKWTAGETSVLKLSREKRKRLCGLLISNRPNWGSTEDAPTTTYTAYFDWRDEGIETGVRNQGSCGSCWAFSAVGAMEAKLKQNHVDTGDDLSEQFLVSCANWDEYNTAGCCGAQYLSKVYDFLVDEGTTDEACFPYYIDGYCKCNPHGCRNVTYSCTSEVKCPDWQSRIEKISGWLEVANNIQAIRDALNSGPVPCGMFVYEDFMAYTGGVYEHTSGDKLGSHAILIVGVDDEPEVIIDGTPTIGPSCWIVKNSWGTGWGEVGYFRIAMSEGVVDYEGDEIRFGIEAAALSYGSGCTSDDECNDNNPCTNDACDNGECVKTYNDNLCDDGDACTTSDTCDGGVCGGTALDCIDNDPCTIDSCVGGSCINEPIICNDNNPCTDDACVDGACYTIDNTISCDDEDACTTSDTCAGGVCSGIEPDCGLDDGCCPEGCASDPDCQPQEVCGDGYCAGSELGEDCNSCPQDCSSFKGECCGDGDCERFEGKRGNCPVDCQ